MSFLDGLAPAHVFTCASVAAYIHSILRAMAQARGANHRAHQLGHLRYSPSHANGKRHEVSQDALLAAEDGRVDRHAEASDVPETAGGILLKAPEPAPCQRRLLLAEDDAETRRLLGAALRRQGFEVVEVCDGAELLEHLSAAVDEHGLAARGIAVRNAGAYDAVIADNQLPELCGLDVLAALRRARCPVPFILITASADEDTRAAARALGAAAFLEKPLSIDDLQTAVRAAIEPH